MLGHPGHRISETRRGVLEDPRTTRALKNNEHVEAGDHD